MTLHELKNSKAIAAACTILVLLVLTACGGGSNGPEPAPPEPPYSYRLPASKADGWIVAGAGSLGMSEQLLEDMMNAMASEFDIVDSIAIAHEGQLVLDETLRTNTDSIDERAGNVDPTMHALFSMSKSLASIAIGVAIDQGIIDGVSTAYLDLFPYTSYENWDDRKNSITLEDVLTMRLGLEWNEWDPPYSSMDNEMVRFYDTQTDFSKALLDLPMASDPGTAFAYNTPATVSLGQAIETNGPLSLLDFGLVHVIAPLQISEIEVLTTPTGLPDLGRGLYLAARDLLKFGQLLADRGRWNGQQIVSEAWADVSTQLHVALSWAHPENFAWTLDGYGYLWWTGHFEHDGQELRTFAARGFGQQLLMVIPELELVIAIYSHAWNEEADEVNQLFDLINRYILPAVT